MRAASLRDNRLRNNRSTETKTTERVRTAKWKANPDLPFVGYGGKYLLHPFMAKNVRTLPRHLRVSGRLVWIGTHHRHRDLSCWVPWLPPVLGVAPFSLLPRRLLLPPPPASSAITVVGAAPPTTPLVVVEEEAGTVRSREGRGDGYAQWRFPQV
jgi:hypothetical protein